MIFFTLEVVKIKAAKCGIRDEVQIAKWTTCGIYPKVLEPPSPSLQGQLNSFEFGKRRFDDPPPSPALLNTKNVDLFVFMNIIQTPNMNQISSSYKNHILSVTKKIKRRTTGAGGCYFQTSVYHVRDH